MCIFRKKSKALNSNDKFGVGLNFDNIDNGDSKFKFILDQSEKLLESYSKDIDSLKNRSFTFIRLIITIMSILSGIVGYLISQVKYDNTLLILIALCVAGFAYPLILVFKNVLPSNYYSIGHDPDKMCKQDFIDSDLDLMIFEQVRHYRNRINSNKKIVDIYASRLSKAMMIISISLFITIAFFLYLGLSH
jgi:ABC-type transport system involved in cytochrome bd biosynthesis fused ATPase/permease subunit